MIRTYLGRPVVVDASVLAGPFEDWSRVRSAGRARRRLRRGHRQNIGLRYEPAAVFDRASGTLLVHPIKFAALEREESLAHERMRADVLGLAL